MNSAKIKKSPRLQRVVKLLESGREFSTRDIIEQAHVCAVNSVISELRRNGLAINCQKAGNQWFYKLEA